MNPDRSSPLRAARWFEAIRHPGVLLVFITFALYGRSLPWGFMLDDFRHLQILEDYHEGRRDDIELYRFLMDPGHNAAARDAGMYPWWLGLDVRYQHWRPAAERLLYWQYVAFGRFAPAYRAVNLVLYALGVLLVLRLYRRVGCDENVARWGALCYALLACHAIPVIFISAQGDTLAVVLVVGGLLAALRFVETRSMAGLVFGTACFLVSLGVKEACLPICIGPLLIELLRRGGDPLNRRPRLRRAAVVSGIWSVMGAAWLYAYLRGGYGSNALIMLNPAQDPIGYALALPVRAVVLLGSLVIPVNPFIFYLRREGEIGLAVYAIAGAVLTAAIAWITFRRLRGREGVAAMALWPLLFLPLLVCTVPDDRVMMLPSIGFCFLVGVWLTHPATTARPRVRRLTAALFFVAHPVVVLIVGQFMHGIEARGNEALRSAVGMIGRELRAGDRFFFMNSTLDSNVLFTQSRFEVLTGRQDVRAGYLTDVDLPMLERIGPNTLRARSEKPGFFNSFLGDMSAAHERPKREGDVFETPDVTGTITKVEDGVVREIELRFRHPLEWDGYHFFMSGDLGRPTPWTPPAWSP